MAELRRRWLDTADCFADLGRKFQARYEGQGGDEVDARLHSAIENAMKSVEEVLISAGHVLGDGTELREDAQRALTSLHLALAATFTDARAEIEAAASKLRLGLADLNAYSDVVDR